MPSKKINRKTKEKIAMKESRRYGGNAKHYYREKSKKKDLRSEDYDF